MSHVCACPVRKATDVVIGIMVSVADEQPDLTAHADEVGWQRDFGNGFRGGVVRGRKSQTTIRALAPVDAARPHSHNAILGLVVVPEVPRLISVPTQAGRRLWPGHKRPLT